MTLAAIGVKAKEIAKDRVAPDFKFSTSWFYGFCKFFRISCRLAAEASGSDRLQIDELHVLDLAADINPLSSTELSLDSVVSKCSLRASSSAMRP
jgi:hypothetical protein